MGSQVQPVGLRGKHFKDHDFSHVMHRLFFFVRMQGAEALCCGHAAKLQTHKVHKEGLLVIFWSTFSSENSSALGHLEQTCDAMQTAAGPLELAVYALVRTALVVST